MLVWSMRCGSVLLLGLIGIEDTRVFRKNCSVTTVRFAKTKIPTSVQLFCDCGLLSVLREAEMGRCASDLPLFRASIHVLTPVAIRNRKKVAILGVFLFLAPGSASCWCHGRGGLGAAPLLMTLGSVVGGASSAARCGDAPGGATWAAGCLGQRDAVNGVGLA